MPPPLPAGFGLDAAPEKVETKKKTTSGSVRAPMDSVLETEIDASLDKLELDGPTGTSLPLSPPITGENQALGFDESTQGAGVSPHTTRDSARAGALSGATERPEPAPNTTAGDQPASTLDGLGLQGKVGGGDAHELGSGELEDAEELGTGEIDALETTNVGTTKGAGGDDDEIVIADDLALDDDSRPAMDEEHTDVGVPVPPIRSNN